MDAAQEKNSKKMAELLHRCPMTFIYTKAEKLNSLIEDYHKILHPKEASSSEIEKEKTAKIMAEFDHIIENLRSVSVEKPLNQ